MGKNTSISLGDHFEGFINGQVESGLYGNKSEVIRAALREMEERQNKATTLTMMERSMRDIEAGRVKPAKRALEQLAMRLGLTIGSQKERKA